LGHLTFIYLSPDPLKTQICFEYAVSSDCNKYKTLSGLKDNTELYYTSFAPGEIPPKQIAHRHIVMPEYAYNYSVDKFEQYTFYKNSNNQLLGTLCAMEQKDRNEKTSETYPLKFSVNGDISKVDSFLNNEELYYILTYLPSNKYSL
jgi:hypothetical protein